MPWFRSSRDKKEKRISSKHSTIEKQRRWPRTRRAFRVVTIVIVTLVLFSTVVSLIGFYKAPEIRLTTRSDSTIAVNEVTALYPVNMRKVLTPHTVEEISRAVASNAGPISIGGGRYSMGGQTATPDGLQLDLREFKGVVQLDTAARTVTVHSGSRWRDVQRAIDPAGLSVKIMQTYNTFTVGGALSVNAHGRYIGQGPLIRSVRAITLVLADGTVVRASATEHPDLFFGAIGGYGALGVIADVTLDLAPDVHVKRLDRTLPLADYLKYFRHDIQPDSNVIFHNADIYPPAYETVHAVSYAHTNEPLTVTEHVQPQDQASSVHRTAYRIISGGRIGSWFRQHLLDPWIFRGHPVTWRNYEASYDVSELEPASRSADTYVLQEYFVPADSLPSFVPRMGEILRAHHVNVVNVSIRHALPDLGTYLAWAPTEVFAYVLYYKQNTDPASRREVGKWTRELIDAAIHFGGRYYLPYQPHATREQFAHAYPHAGELFALKRRVDPTNKFTNTLWDLYRPDSAGRAPDVTAARMPGFLPSEARIALDTIKDYARDEVGEYLTHPEWDLVYSSEAYARWLGDGKRPSGFPYVTSVGTFWRGYAATWSASHTRYPTSVGDHVMLGVIGLSTALEYGLKGLYENTIGRLFELNRPDGGTAEEKYAAQVADDYAKLIVEKGWYEFGFAHALKHLWTDVPIFGPGPLRKLERRFALSGEYAIKAIYATLIGVGTSSAYVADVTQRYLVVAGWSDSLSESATGADTALRAMHRMAWLDRRYALLTVPRYTPYRDALLALSRHADRVRVAEISANRIVTFTGTAPREWALPPRASEVVAYVAPADPARVRVVIAVDARDLLEVLAAAQRDGLVVDHIYDY
ncbi:MAG TPA: FAD-binding oxidoreductase [Gemmatimonadaceae bacterium]|nr:FAD-binding oxidoreductase [Gemmatimonadaceae bacterium]